MNAGFTRIHSLPCYPFPLIIFIQTLFYCSDMGLIFDIKRFAVHDGPGIRTTVFFKGCPLRCAWCHNPESISPKPEIKHKQVKLDGTTFVQKEEIGKEMSVDEVVAEVLKDRKYWEHSEGGVTLSGGEPLLQANFTLALLKALKKENVHTAVDTCGFVSQKHLLEAAKIANLFLFDLKLVPEEQHKQFTEQSNQKILKNLEALLNAGANLRIRIPVIPGVNNDEANINAFIDFLDPFKDKIQQVDLLPFHNTAKHKFSKEQLPEIYQTAQTMSKDDLVPTQTKFIERGINAGIGG